MRKKRLLILVLALCLLLSLLGCSGAFALPYLQGITLDPITCPDGTQQDIGQLLYEGLVQLDLQMQPQAALAQSWSYDAATYTWTIHLRSGVTFTDGSAFTAADAAARLLSSVSAGPIRPSFPCWTSPL